MSLSSRRELLAAVGARYKQASRAQKGQILDELVATCGYNRKYAIVAVRRAVSVNASVSAASSQKTRTRSRSRRPTYGPDVGAALLRLWKLSRGLCAKRLVAQLPELIGALERHGELCLPEVLKAKLLRISPATAGRLLSQLRRCGQHGITVTTAGTLLRQQIPLHTFSDWKEAKPGFLEIDLVAHCGDTAAGQFAYTLTATDVASGWTECVALPNRGQLAVLAAIEQVQARLTFGLLGIDSDNGAEFINVTLASFCQERKIAFTRGRPYKKNDQCHVEQKNGCIVRPLVGYARYEGAEAVAHMNRLYGMHRLHLNFFSPSMKLTDKQRHGAKVHKVYDAPQTPYARLIAYGVWDKEQQEQMRRFYESLNPAAIGRRIDELEAGLKHYAIRGVGVETDREHSGKTTIHRLPDNLFGKKTK